MHSTIAYFEENWNSLSVHVHVFDGGGNHANRGGRCKLHTESPHWGIEPKAFLLRGYNANHWATMLLGCIITWQEKSLTALLSTMCCCKRAVKLTWCWFYISLVLCFIVSLCQWGRFDETSNKINSLQECLHQAGIKSLQVGFHRTTISWKVLKKAKSVICNNTITCSESDDHKERK